MVRRKPGRTVVAGAALGVGLLAACGPGETADPLSKMRDTGAAIEGLERTSPAAWHENRVSSTRTSVLVPLIGAGTLRLTAQRSVETGEGSVSYVSAEKFFPNGEQVQITATVGSEGLLVTCSDNKTPEGYDANVSQKRAVTIGGSEATTGPEDTGMANELLGRIMGWTVITQEAVVRDETVMKSPEGTC